MIALNKKNAESSYPIVSIKDKSFENVISVLMNNDMVKVVKEF